MGQLVRSVAASRQAKELFKALQKVNVIANPFDHKATTARYDISDPPIACRVKR